MSIERLIGSENIDLNKRVKLINFFNSNVPSAENRIQARKMVRRSAYFTLRDH
jgi:hypothetical protein